MEAGLYCAGLTVPPGLTAPPEEFASTAPRLSESGEYGPPGLGDEQHRLQAFESSESLRGRVRRQKSRQPPARSARTETTIAATPASLRPRLFLFLLLEEPAVGAEVGAKAQSGEGSGRTGPTVVSSGHGVLKRFAQ